MNILFVYTSLFNPIKGGVERVTDLLAKEFILRTHKVFYLHNKKSNELLDYQYPAPIFFFPFEDYRDSRNIVYYHEFLRDNKIDIVINQCGNFEDSVLYLNTIDTTASVSVLHMTPLISYNYLASDVLQLRGNSILDRLKLMGRCLLYPWIKHKYLEARRNVIHYVIEESDCVCLLSKQFISEMNFLLRKPTSQSLSSKIQVIANPNTYKVDDTHWKAKKNILLFVGRLDKGQKRPDRLIQIWSKLYLLYPNWEMVIVGDGPMRQSLLRKCARLERISMVGYQNPEPWYRSASILCLTSNFEGWGMVLTEAMSFGVIPYAFKSFASVTDIIEDGKTGMLVTPFSITDYVNKLRLLMDNENLRQSMQLRCREKVRCFDIHFIADEWEKLFENLRYKKKI